MENSARLSEWMSQKGYSNRQLADEVGFSYDYIYSVVNNRKRITGSFKYRFIERFGWQEAAKVFEGVPVPGREPQPA
jgi:plasmid maintenance system antidote protein VapI